MAIQMRRGQEVNFDADKMLPGEWAVSLDTRYVRMCFAPGVCVRMATYDAFEVDMAKIEAILAECQTIEEVVTRINTEVSVNAQAVAEYTSQAKQYRDEAKLYKEQASAIVGVDIATKEIAGLVKGGDNYIAEDGTLMLTRATTDRTLTESQNGGIRIISMDGESQQKQYSGKNLGNLDDRTITAGTNAYAFASWVIANYIKTNMTYTVSFYTDFTSNMSVNVYDANISAWGAGSNEVKSSNGRASFTFKTGDNLTNFNKLLIYAGVTGITAGNTVKVWDIQIEEGSTMTEYEPYVGGIASPNPIYPQSIDSVEVSEIWTESKNIVTEESASTTYSAYITTENQWRYSTDSKSVRVKARPNTTYTVSISETVSLFRVGCINSERYPSTDGEAFILTNVVRNTSNAPITITTSEDTQYIVVQVPMATKTDTLQIEKGSVVTPYQKHFETKETLPAPITLRGIGDAKDVLCKQNGVFGVFRMVGEEIVDSSLVNSLKMSATGNFSYLSGLLADKAKYFATDLYVNNFACSHFGTNASIDLIEAKVDNGASISSSGSLYFRIKGYDFNSYKNFVSNNTIKVQYELATPTFEPLPLADQIALHKLESFGGVTYLFTDSTIEPIIEVEYGTSKVGGYAIKGLNNGEISLLELEQLKTLTSELATQIVAGSEA